jgi:3-methyladenine DNA glycosylase AlkD
MNALEIHHHLQTLADEDKASVLQRFFKTGPGEYGEGDVFLGIRVPQLRKLAKTHQALALPEITTLLRSPIHEERLLALLILVRAYSRGDMSRQEEIYRLYLEHTAFINNWDLVDASAEHMVGAHLKDRSKEPLYRLARSPLLWERRIAIMATFHYIKGGDHAETLRLAAMLLRDGEDLIHKAVGWMLREVGKRDVSVEEAFLKEHYRTMPRTMLRYAIERFPEERRQRYLKGEM